MAAAALLTEAELGVIEARVKALEARVGSQVIAAFVERSDIYHGLRWRAFAVAVSVRALGAVLCDETRRSWSTQHAVLWSLGLVLGAGAAAALAATVLPGFARLFLEPLRADAEVQRRAETLFLERELFGTSGRDALLILVSGFERRAAIYADRGLRGRVPDAAWHDVLTRMNSKLAAGRPAAALLAGLDAAEAVLGARPSSSARTAADEIPDRPITEAGPR